MFLAGAGLTPAAEMEVIGLDDWSGVVAAHQPDVVVVDIWARWCMSCIERFRLTSDDPNDPFDEADIEVAVKGLLEEKA